MVTSSSSGFFKDVVRERRDLMFLDYATFNWIHQTIVAAATFSREISERFAKFTTSIQCLYWLEAVFRVTDNPEFCIDQFAAEMTTLTSTSDDIGERYTSAMEQFVAQQ